MSTTLISLYDLATGIFTGKRRQVFDVAAATPEGMGAYPGAVDPQRWRVDVASGDLVEWQPPAPADDELRTWSWDELAWRYVAMPTLAAVKLERWAQIKVAREATEFGGFVWDGSTFDSDAISQSRIMGAVQLALLAMSAEQPFSIAWTLADNAVRTLEAAEVVAVGVALGTHVATQHATARALREQIYAASTPEDVEAISWPAT